jgi:hypothetical protein
MTGGKEEQVLLQLQRDQRLDEDAAAAAVEQAKRWLRRHRTSQEQQP